MKIKGLNVDTEAIGDGLYAMICERNEEAIVAFGMLPKWIMDMAESQVREKVIKISADQIGCEVEDLKPFVDKKLLDDIVNPVVREIGTAIYGAASRAGKMIV